MSRYYRTLIENGFLLDQYPNAAVAYSLRKLREGYTGSAIRVRRSVDNAEQDIGFDTTGNLDLNEITSWYGNNFLLQSQTFDSTSWSKANSTITPDVEIAPDLTLTADKLVESTGTSTKTLTQSLSNLTIGSSYFFSVYLKAGERNVADIVSGISSISRVLRVNLTTGTVVSNSFPNTPTIINVGNDWWKIELFETATVTSIPTGMQIRLTNGSSSSYSGTAGWGFFIWGAQVSIGSTVVPYFPTTISKADIVSIPIWYDQSGNGNNAVQTSLTLQGTIVRNGVVPTSLGKPSVSFNAQWYSISPSPADLQGLNFGINVVNKTTASNLVTFGNTVVGGRPRFPIWLSNGDVSINTIVIGNDAGLGSRLIIPYVNNGIGGAFVNSIALPTMGTIDQLSSTCTTLGRFTSAGGSTGNYQEMIWWKQNLLSVRTGIEQNINQYYGIY